MTVTSATIHPGHTPTLQTAQAPVALAPAFFGRFELDASIQDSFNLRTFKELMAEQAQAEMPYYVVASRDALGSIRFFDGPSLMQSYFAFGNTESPFSREWFTDAKIYKIDPNGQRLEEFCNFFDLPENDQHYAKFLQAANLSVAPERRGATRFYVGGYYEFKGTEPNHLQQAEFWYKKAAEDAYFAANLAFGGWYELGTYYPKSPDNALEQYKKAFSLIPQNLYAETAKQIEAKIHLLSAQRIKV